MSRPIRCHTHKPSPYLEKYWQAMVRAARPDLPDFTGTTANYIRDMLRDSGLKVVDVGGGNGRNTTFLHDVGVRHCVLLDQAGDYGVKWDIEQPMPFVSGFADIVLVNYVLMLLRNEGAVRDAIANIERITKPGGCVMVEVQWLPGAGCLVHTPRQAEAFVKGLANQFGWPMLHASKYRFIAQKPK